MGSSIIARVDLAGLEPSSAAVAGPSTVYHTLCTHIQRQHHQNLVGKTAINISARSFHQSGAASAGPPAPGSAATGRRMMYVIKRNVEASAQQPAVPEGVDSTVLIEDAAAQRRSDWILESRKAEVAATAADKGKAKATDDDAEPQDGAVAMDVDPALPTTITTIPRPSHFRSTIAVLPGSFDQLLANTLILPPGGPSQSNAQAASTRWTHRPAVISLEGTVFRLGGHRQVQAGPTFTAGRGDVGAADWLVRVLTVAVRGNAPRPWAAVEIEYLARPSLPPDSRFLAAALKSLLPVGASIRSYTPSVDDLLDVGLGTGLADSTDEGTAPSDGVTPSVSGSGSRSDFGMLKLLQREGML